MDKFHDDRFRPLLWQMHRRYGLSTSKQAGYAGVPAEYRDMGIASARGSRELANS